jgi:DNA-binding NarL/FixJ family response regulator
MAQSPQIILVEDHQPFRKGLKLFFTVENIARVIGEASDGPEFIALLSQLRPDLVLLDIDIPQINGIEVTQKALELIPDLKIIAFTMDDRNDYIIQMKNLGLRGFILRSCNIQDLKKAVVFVNSGETYFPDSLPLKAIDSFEFKDVNTS